MRFFKVLTDEKPRWTAFYGVNMHFASVKLMIFLILTDSGFGKFKINKDRSVKNSIFSDLTDLFLYFFLKLISKVDVQMKKFIEFFISIGISLVISISFVGCGNTSKNESNESAKVAESTATDVSILKLQAVESYKTLLSGMYDANKDAEESLYFFMRDLDADGIEELLVWAWPKMTAYTFDGALKNIGKQDFSPGTTRWMYSENASYPGIFSSNLGGGRVHYYYHSLKEGKFTERHYGMRTIPVLRKHLV